jgi:hypothetical protein
MELEEFRSALLENVRASAESFRDFRLSRFVQEVSELLADAEEFTDFEPCHFEGIGNRNRRLLVDGYAFDDADNSMVLVVADFSDMDSTPSMGLTDVKKSFGMLRAYVEESISERLTSGPTPIEESEPGWGLAYDLIKWSRKVDRFRFYLITDRRLAMRTKELPEESIENVPVELHVWDIERLHRARESSSGRDDTEVNFVQMGGSLPCLKTGGAEGEYEGYLCMIPGNILAKIYERYGSRLLEGNVRSFLTLKGGVNKGIRNTILNRPSMFFAYNNGISATAEGVNLDAVGRNIVSATNLQIVNGGQTTASLALAMRKDKADLENVYVQMKLSVLPGEKAAILIPDIAKFANSQNKVNEADFFSNHPYHIRIEDFSRRIAAPATKGAQHKSHWFYERARGQYDNAQASMSRAEKNTFKLLNPRDQLLKKTDVAKLENTWRCLPHKVSLGNEKNFRIFAEWISPLWEHDATQFHEEYFRQLIAKAILFRTTEKLVSDQSWYQSGYRANIVTYTLAKLQQMVKDQGNGLVLDFRRIWDRQSVPDELNLEIGKLSKEIFEVLTHPERKKENVTEWAKIDLCWDWVIKLNHKLSPAVLERLVSLGAVGASNQQAKYQQQEDDVIAIQKMMIEMGSEKWRKIRQWALNLSLLTPVESSLLAKAAAISTRIPTDKDCKSIWKLRSKLSEEGCPELN